jgi:ABC-2 type transport system ATP-binding protein
VKDFGLGARFEGNIVHNSPGAVVGLLGPDGAGKTTCIDILRGTTLPNGGSVEYFGQDFFANKQASLRRINFASAYHTCKNRVTVRENLLVFAHLYQLERPTSKIDGLLEYFEIQGIANRRQGDPSAGQRTFACSKCPGA